MNGAPLRGNLLHHRGLALAPRQIRRAGAGGADRADRRIGELLQRRAVVVEIIHQPVGHRRLVAHQPRVDHRHAARPQDVELRLDRGVGLRRQHADQAARGVFERHARLIRRLGAGFLHHRAEPHDVALDHRAKLLRRGRDDERGLRQHLVLHLLAVQRLDELGVELLHDRRRQAGRPEQAEPLLHLHVGIAGLGHGHQVGQTRMALRAGDRQHAKPAALHKGPGRQIGREQHVHAPRHHIGDGRRDAAVGHVKEFDAGVLGEQHAEQMPAGADALRAVGQALGLGLGVGDQLGDRLRRARDRNRQDVVEGQQRR